MRPIIRYSGALKLGAVTPDLPVDSVCCAVLPAAASFAEPLLLSALISVRRRRERWRGLRSAVASVEFAVSE
jgi:hypothetical protein